jgi:hypothetical protein
MGITDGWTEAKATNVVTQLQIGPRLKDRTGCLDMSCLLHTMFGLCCSATRVKDLVTGLTTLVGVFDQTKLRGLCLNFIVHLTRRIENRLIVVFDGPDPPGKSRIRAARNAAVTEARARLEELRTDESCGEGTFTKVFRKTMRWDDSLYADLVKQFNLYGIAYIQSPAEADAQVRHLVASGLAHYYIGSDFDLAPFMDVWDIFTFGCSLSNGGRFYVRGPSVTAATSDFVTVAERGHLLAAAALSGNDFSVGCQRVSFKGALKLIASSTLTSTSSVADIITVIQMHGALTTDDILEMYLSFNHQPVYDPATKKIVRLNPVPDSQERLLATSAGLLRDHQVGFGNLECLGRPVDPFAFEPWVLALDKPALLNLLVQRGGLPEADLQGADVVVLRNVYARVAHRVNMAVESTAAEAQKTTEYRKRLLATSVLFECSDPGKAAVAVAVITPAVAQRAFLQGTNWDNGLMSVGAIQSYAKGIAVVDRIVSFKWGKVDGCVSDEFIRAKVSSSVKALEYNVVLRVSTTVCLVSGNTLFDRIVSFFCDCKNGLCICKHLGAIVLKYCEFSKVANATRACTDLLNQWIMPGTRAKATIEEVKAIREERTPSYLTAIREQARRLLKDKDAVRDSNKEIQRRASELFKERREKFKNYVTSATPIKAAMKREEVRGQKRKREAQEEDERVWAEQSES